MNHESQPPTDLESAVANVQVTKIGNPPIIQLRKELPWNGEVLVQEITLTIPQLRGLTIEETF